MWSYVPPTWTSPGYISLVGEERYDDAIRLIRKDNPFPSVCGLVCEHPCETHCRRTIVDSPLNIRGIKRFAVDHAGEVPAPPRAPSSGKTVAIVGGGPSGLTAAYFLSLMGHTVTVFERKPKLGGMLRYGIPSYRLPGSYLDRDIDTILSTGVSVRVNCEVGTDVTLEELRRDYDSLYLAIGASLHKGLGIPGEDAKGVLSAIEMLDITIRSVKPDFTGKHVVVVGGGNVAMDAARTARRLGAEVTVVYRRGREEMPARAEEVHHAEQEGIRFQLLTNPTRILGDEKGWVSGVECVRMELGEPDASGRRRPTAARRAGEVRHRHRHAGGCGGLEDQPADREDHPGARGDATQPDRGRRAHRSHVEAGRVRWRRRRHRRGNRHPRHGRRQARGSGHRGVSGSEGLTAFGTRRRCGALWHPILAARPRTRVPKYASPSPSPRSRAPGRLSLTYYANP